ncbi:MAG TPA: hypothetical protein VFO41_04100 [Alphaproteobacteria bacterium]|nr:hypothetical protein [Alphaproteobacteria bacterium]
MSWPADEAKTKLIGALQTFKELYGDDKTIDFLEQELVREHIVKERRAAQKQALLAPPSADAAAAREIEIAVETLMFYGDPSNYESPGRGKPSAVVKDGGERARETLATLGEDDDDEGDA